MEVIKRKQFFDPSTNYYIVEDDFAMWLKMDGFNTPCRAYYDISDGKFMGHLPYFLTSPTKNSLYAGKFISAPTIYEVEEYFREKYNISINNITAYTGLERITGIHYYPVISMVTLEGVKTLNRDDKKVFESHSQSLYYALRLIKNEISKQKSY